MDWGSSLPTPGERIAALEKSPTTSRQRPTLFMPMPGGLAGLIGLAAMAAVSAIGDPSRKLASLCGVLGSGLAPLGNPTAALEKSPTTSRQRPTLFMPMLVGQG